MKTTSHQAVLKTVTFVTCILTATTFVADAKKKKKKDKYDKNDNDATNSEADLSDNHKIPPDPVGWLTAYPTIVQTGTKPTITWSITYPSLVKDYIDIIEPGTIVPKEKLDIEVRVLGNGVTVSSSNSNSFSFVEGQASLSFDGNGYNSIFYGDNHDVNPSTVVWSKKNAQAGQKLKFGGRYYYNGWGPNYNSDSGTQNVRVLVNGDTPPANVPDHDAPSLEDFIKPYLGGDGKVNIGPMDAIIFMELTHTDSQQGNSGYDLQDMVLLVTFTSNNPKNNNGHGNNVDGIDSSNPGNAPFMQYDTDPTVDDES
ncbi:MAG: hypothetical protein AB8D78_15430 [Akkermansiaceae bacterium]